MSSEPMCDGDGCGLVDEQLRQVRVADDGLPYTMEDFKSWSPEDWPDAWSRARLIPITSNPPEGLIFGLIGTSMVEQAISEILPWFPSANSRAATKQRNAFEIGWTMDHSNLKLSQVVAQAAQPADKFPGVCSLVAAAMHLLTGNMNVNMDRLNISCLWYSPGHGIPMHCDRLYAYEQDVYGCVLLNTSDAALEFHSPAPSDKDCSRYVVHESPGTCFVQRGKARFDWKHGVLPLSFGERLSVTWRWFLPDVHLAKRAGPAQQARNDSLEQMGTPAGGVGVLDHRLQDVETDRRIAYDGYAYAHTEFMLWQPWAWEHAARTHALREPPPGLSISKVPLLPVGHALAEIEPHLFRDEWAPGLNVFEIGLSFYKADYKDIEGNDWNCTTVHGPALSSFPHLQNLIMASTEQLHAKWKGELRLNVICRLYKAGSSIVMHTDKQDWFEEDVYGCVLKNTSDRVLELHENHGATGNAVKLYISDEQPGTCYLQRGQARFLWNHGIAPLTSGERISVTWRWFQSHVDSA